MITIATIPVCMIVTTTLFIMIITVTITAIVRLRRRYERSFREANSRQTTGIGVFTTVFSLLGSASGLILMLETFERRILYVDLRMIMHLSYSSAYLNQYFIYSIKVSFV